VAAFSIKADFSLSVLSSRIAPRSPSLQGCGSHVHDVHRGHTSGLPPRGGGVGAFPVGGAIEITIGKARRFDRLLTTIKVGMGLEEGVDEPVGPLRLLSREKYGAVVPDGALSR